MRGAIGSSDHINGGEQGFPAIPAEAADAFRRLDLNGDGYLSQEELLQNAREFSLSDDPQAPGNWLVGPY